MIQYHQLISIIELLHPLNSLSYQLGVRNAVIEELRRRYAEVVAYCKQFRQRRQGLTRRNIVDISTAMTKIIAHLILRYALLQTELSNPVPYKIVCHSKITSYYYDTAKEICYTQRKYVVFP